MLGVPHAQLGRAVGHRGEVDVVHQHLWPIVRPEAGGEEVAAGEQLATKKDVAAFEVLVEMLRSDQAQEQTAAIRALQRLGDPRA